MMLSLSLNIGEAAFGRWYAQSIHRGLAQTQRNSATHSMSTLAAAEECASQICNRSIHRGRSQRSPYSVLRSMSTLAAAEDYDSQIRNHPLVGALEIPQDPNRPFFPIYYNDVYEVILPDNHRFPMEKYGKVRKLAQTWIASQAEKRRNTIVYDFRVSPLATVEELTTTHSPEYVDRYLRGDLTEAELRNVGFPWSINGVKRSLSSVGGTLAAAVTVCEALRQHPNSPAWSAHVAGGTHHAFHDYGEGFCVFSDIAVAANVVLHRFPDIIRRVLIIDLDVHQGNGNAVLFQGRSDVVTFSMHCAANYFSPKEESDLDVELPVNCTDETYLMTLRHWLKQIGAQGGGFDLVFFQAGVDVLEHDRLGRMNLTSDGVKRRNELVFDFAREHVLPLIITMGGGYPRRDWTPILEAHANVYYQAQQYLATKYATVDMAQQ